MQQICCSNGAAFTTTLLCAGRMMRACSVGKQGVAFHQYSRHETYMATKYATAPGLVATTSCLCCNGERPTLPGLHKRVMIGRLDPMHRK